MVFRCRYRAGIMGPNGLFCAGAEQASMPGFADSSRYYVDAISLTDPAALLVCGDGVDVVEVVLNAARDGYQQQPGGSAHGSEPVRAPAGQEHELSGGSGWTACCP